MEAMKKAMRTKDSHDVQNTLVSVKQAGYQCGRREGKADDAPRWFAKLGTRKKATKTQN